MNALYRVGRATAAEIAHELDEMDGYHSVRVTLAGLAKKGQVTRQRKLRETVYAPAVERARAGRSAVRALIRTFFQGSPSRAILTLLDETDLNLSPEQLDAIATRVEVARKRRSK